VSLDVSPAPEAGGAMITGVLSNDTDAPIEFYPGWSLEQWTGEAWTKVDDVALGTDGSPGRNCLAGCEYMPAIFISEPGDQYDFVLLLLPPITQGTYRLDGSTSTSPPFVLTPEILYTENT
jgi:hypothetical protein